MGWMSSRRRKLSAAALACGLVGVLPSSAMAAGQAGGLKPKGSQQAGTNGSPLVDRGGKILSASKTYAIFWGPSSAWASDVAPGIDTLFSGFNGSAYLGIAQQYMRSSSISSTFIGEQFDSSTPPNKITASTLGAEVAKLYPGSLDPNGIYFVYTSGFPKGGGFCAWHNQTTVNGQQIAVAYMPNTSGQAGCDPGNNYGLGGSEGLRSLANVTAHEFMEAVTDTLPAQGTYGWLDGSGQEIGDKCAWQFTAPVTLGNGSVWQLQEEWSNAAGGCAQG